MPKLFRAFTTVIFMTWVFVANAQTKYAFVYGETNCAGRFAISNVFTLSGNALNLSKEEICAKYKNHHFTTNQCGSSASFESCNTEIYNEVGQAERAYELIVAQSKTRYGSASVYGTLFFSISSWDGPSNPTADSKHYIVPYLKFKGACGNKMAIGQVLAYDCSPLTVINNFNRFYNKTYAKSVGYFIDSRNVSSYQAFSNFEEGVNWRQSQINDAVKSAIVVYHVDDFNETCAGTKFGEPDPVMKPIDIGGTWKFVMSWSPSLNLAPVHGKIYFDIGDDAVIKGRIISDPLERLTFHYNFTGGQLNNSLLRFDAQTNVAGIDQLYDLRFDCLQKLSGTVRNFFTKSAVRTQGDNIPATIEMTR